MTMTEEEIDLLIGQCNAIKKQNENLQQELRKYKQRILELEEEMRS